VEYKDYYKVLGVARTATEKEIRSAYRKLARDLHPDRRPGDKEAEQRFKEINEAYEVLSDREKRARYDQLGANWQQFSTSRRTGGTGAGRAGDVGDLFRGDGGTTFTVGDLGDVLGRSRGGSGGPSTFSDFFETFFGRGGGGPSGGGASSIGQRGMDVEQAVEISLEEAFTGATRVVQLTDERSQRARRIEVKIPQGVADGARVRIAGQGGPGLGKAQPGDLMLLISVRPHPVFAREGDDLRVTVPVPVTVAALGGEIEVPTPRGNRLALKIPPETQSGRVFRLRRQGMPRINRPDERGDLLAEIAVHLPTPLTERHRALFTEMAQLEPSRAAV